MFFRFHFSFCWIIKFQYSKLHFWQITRSLSFLTPWCPVGGMLICRIDWILELLHTFFTEKIYVEREHFWLMLGRADMHTIKYLQTKTDMQLHNASVWNCVIMWLESAINEKTVCNKILFWRIYPWWKWDLLSLLWTRQDFNFLLTPL